MTRAGKGVVVPLFGALYCALDKHCGSVTDTFTGMMSEQIKSAQEEREKLFPILNDGKGGEKKAQVQKHPVSRSATGAPMPPDDEDNNGKQAKKMNDQQIQEMTGNKNWHKTNIKRNIARRYGKELRGSTNFDFYRNYKSGDIYIQGNKPNSPRIRINIQEFL
ncbi:hypothetical protein [Neisseria weaveri]|uniref:hypothetical protein n=1 Tax=Neisseria weaveri TaxID=28091 RepID=UPI000559E6FF|nr:hypothetical protein [Neisseria weaveri]